MDYDDYKLERARRCQAAVVEWGLVTAFLIAVTIYLVLLDNAMQSAWSGLFTGLASVRLYDVIKTERLRRKYG